MARAEAILPGSRVSLLLADNTHLKNADDSMAIGASVCTKIMQQFRGPANQTNSAATSVQAQSVIWLFRMGNLRQPIKAGHTADSGAGCLQPEPCIKQSKA